MVNMEIRRLALTEYPITDALDTLCTNLSFVGEMKRVLLTSCRPQEGKSYVAMHMMRTMATRLGMHVVLMDADIRSSTLRGTYGIRVNSDDTYLGLTGYLSGRCSMEEIVGRTNIPGADLILAGKTVMNSLLLYNSSRMQELFERLASQYDAVLVDAPPVGTIIDAAKLATLCDGALFVVESGMRAHRLKEAVAQIEKANCPVIGYVLNKFKGRSSEGEGYYYGRQEKLPAKSAGAK